MKSALRDPRALLLLGYTLTGLALLLSNGAYSPVPLLLTLAGFMAMGGALLCAVRAEEPVTQPPVGIAAGCLVILLVAQLPYANVIYIQSLLYDRAALAVTAVTAAAVAAAYGTRRARWSAWRQRVFALALCAGLAIQWFVPWASPEPFIDVFVMLQGAAQALLQGHDPYTSTFFDIYGGAGLSKPITTYTYPPANIVILAPFFALFGDVRFGMLAGNVVTLALLWRLARRSDDAWAELLALLFVFHPRLAFTIEQAWIDPLILGVLSLALLLRERGGAWSAVAYGVFLSMKQYLVFFVPLWWLLERRPRMVLVGLFAGALTIAPFLLWHPGPAVFNGVLFHLSDAFRADSLTVVSFLHGAVGFTPGRWLSALVGGVFTVLTLRSCRGMPEPFGFLLAASATYFALFLLGSQAFCNYYMLVSGLLLLACAAYRDHERG